MKPYRKRAYESWNAGKRGKETSDSAERQFSKREISQQLKEDEDDYLLKYHKGKRTRNQKARLEYRIRWYEARIAEWESRGLDRISSMFRDSLRKARKELKAYLDEKGQV